MDLDPDRVALQDALAQIVALQFMTAGLDAAPGDPRVPVLDDVIHLLNPVAMRARMEYVPAVYPRREVLAERTRVSMSLISAEPATTAELGRQLRELRASPFGRWLRPSADGPAAESCFRLVWISAAIRDLTPARKSGWIESKFADFLMSWIRFVFVLTFSGIGSLRFAAAHPL